jgi:hypothetical protein
MKLLNEKQALVVIEAQSALGVVTETDQEGWMENELSVEMGQDLIETGRSSLEQPVVEVIKINTTASHSCLCSKKEWRGWEE